MIVTPSPRLGHIVADIWRPLALLFIWDVIVTITYYLLPFTAPGLPVTLFGTALALFLGFRSNSAYARWWEGRQLWGLMINASRNIARAAVNFLPDPQAAGLKQRLVRRQIAYVNALRCQLRRQPQEEVVHTYLRQGESDEALARVNIANGILDGNGRLIAEARDKGWLDTVQQVQMEAVLVDIANAQGGMERLKNTPLPHQYRWLPVVFTHLFCVLLPIGLVETLGYATPLGSTIAGLMFLAVLTIGDELVDPFAGKIHDLPLTQMCRTIEIDLLQAIGEQAPPPMQADADGVLW